MFDTVIRWLYNVITRSGIVLYLVPFLMSFSPFLILGDKHGANYQLADEDGATIKLTRYNGRLYPAFGVKKISGVASLNIRRDDVMLCGYPKSGCHWVYEILHMLLARKVGLSKLGKEIGGFMEALSPIVLDSLPSPRVLNSHLLYDELPSQIKEKKTKIIVTVRSPKDTVVSYYNHLKSLHFVYHYDGTFNSYFKLFMAGKFEYGCYFDSILSWEKAMKNQTDNPILVVEYEMLKRNPVLVVREIASFLNISVTDSFIEKVCLECDFHRMKEKRSGTVVGQLFRKGEVGDWRNWLTDSQSKEIDKMWQARMLNCTYQPDLS